MAHLLIMRFSVPEFIPVSKAKNGLTYLNSRDLAFFASLARWQKIRRILREFKS